MRKKQFITILLASLMLAGCMPNTSDESSSYEHASESSINEISSSESSSSESSVLNSIPFTEIPMTFMSDENLSLIIKSTEELAAALRENEWLLTGVPNRWSEFTGDFFTNNAVILYTSITQSISLTYLIEYLHIVDGKLELALIAESYGGLMLDMEGYASFVISVAQSDIENFTSFTTKVRFVVLEVRMSIFALHEAYDIGFLNKDYIMHIGFFVSDQLYELKAATNERIAIDFTPQFERPTLLALNESMITKIKAAYYEKNKVIMDNELEQLISNGYWDENTNVLDTIILHTFLGEYDGAFAVQIASTLFQYGLGSFEVIIDNISWSQFAPEVLIFK